MVVSSIASHVCHEPASSLTVVSVALHLQTNLSPSSAGGVTGGDGGAPTTQNQRRDLALEDLDAESAGDTNGVHAALLKQVVGEVRRVGFDTQRRLEYMERAISSLTAKVDLLDTRS